jgi:hypothetical protein
MGVNSHPLVAFGNAGANLDMETARRTATRARSRDIPLEAADPKPPLTPWPVR